MKLPTVNHLTTQDNYAQLNIQEMPEELFQVAESLNDALRQGLASTSEAVEGASRTLYLPLLVQQKQLDSAYLK